MIFCLSSGILNILDRAENNSDHLNFAACCNNLFLSTLGEAVSYNSQLLSQLTITKDTNTITNVLQNAALY